MPIRRGEVYFVDLEPIIGHEQGGRRPVVVVSNDEVNRRSLAVAVVPGTKRQRAVDPFPANVRVPADEAGLSHPTVFMAFQIRALDHGRFRETCRGILSSIYLMQLDRAMSWTLDLHHPLP